MNLLDIHALDWSQQCLNACGPDLRKLLGPPILSTKSLGQISHFMVERFGFDPGCLVTAFTGDNPASLAGIGLCPGELCISLGNKTNLGLLVGLCPIVY